MAYENIGQVFIHKKKQVRAAHSPNMLPNQKAMNRSKNKKQTERNETCKTVMVNSGAYGSIHLKIKGTSNLYHIDLNKREQNRLQVPYQKQNWEYINWIGIQHNEKNVKKDLHKLEGLLRTG